MRPSKRLVEVAGELRESLPCSDAGLFQGKSCLDRHERACRSRVLMERWGSERFCDACQIYWHVAVAAIKAAEIDDNASAPIVEAAVKTWLPRSPR